MSETRARTGVPSTKRWDKAEARAALDEFAASGQTMAAFAEARGYTAQRLRRWRDVFAAQGVGGGRLLPVVVRPSRAAPSDAAAVVVVGVARLEITDPEKVDAEWLGAVLASAGRS